VAQYFGGLLSAVLQTLPFKCLKCRLVIVWPHFCVFALAMALPLKEKENNSPAEAFIRLHCPYESCEKFYKNKKSLLEHFRLYPAHKPETVSRKRKTIKDTVETFLNEETTYSRRQRVRELMLQLTDEEIVAFTVPRVVNVVPPVDIFLEGSSCFGDVFKKLVTFREQINLCSLSATSNFLLFKSSVFYFLSRPKEEIYQYGPSEQE